MTETDVRPFPVDLAELMERQKERIDGHEDFVPSMVEAYVHDKPFPLWTVFIGETNEEVNARDAGLHAAKVMASAAAADFILFSFDTHMSQSTVNPTTGKPWEPGEMQRMCDEEGYCDTGNIRDNLVVAIARRSDGKLRFESIPYHFHGPEDDRKIMFWDNTLLDEWTDNDAKMGGRIPDALRAAITDPPMSALLDKLGVDYKSIPHHRLHSILGGARTLAATGIHHHAPDMFINAIPAETEEESNVIKESASANGLDVRSP